MRSRELVALGADLPRERQAGDKKILALTFRLPFLQDITFLRKLFRVLQVKTRHMSGLFWTQLTLNVVPLFFAVVQLLYSYKKQRLCECSGKLRQKTNTLLTMSTVSGFIAVVIDTVRMYLPETFLSSSDTQRTLYIIATAFFGNAIFCIGLLSILWLRQRELYNKKALLHLSNKHTRLISKYVIFYMLVLGIAIAAVTTFLPLVNVAMQNVEKQSP